MPPLRLVPGLVAGLTLALALLAPAAPAAAQPLREPAPGTAERRAILDATRAAIDTHPAISGPVEFAVHVLRAQGDWAFVFATPQRPGGAALRELVAYCPDADQDVAALLQRQGARWRVAEWGTCATDVFYQVWLDQHPIRPELIGMESAEAPDPPNEVDAIGTVWAPDGNDPWLALRTMPSTTQGTRLARMPHGAQVEVLDCLPQEDRVGSDRGHWCRVRFQGQEGWAFGAYLVIAG